MFVSAHMLACVPACVCVVCVCVCVRVHKCVYKEDVKREQRRRGGRKRERGREGGRIREEAGPLRCSVL